MFQALAGLTFSAQHFRTAATQAVKWHQTSPNAGLELLCTTRLHIQHQILQRVPKIKRPLMKLSALKGLLLSHTNMRVQVITISLSSLKKLPTAREGSECRRGSIRCASSRLLLVPTNCTGCRSHLLVKKTGKHTLGTVGLISFFFFLIVRWG